MCKKPDYGAFSPTQNSNNKDLKSRGVARKICLCLQGGGEKKTRAALSYTHTRIYYEPVFGWTKVGGLEKLHCCPLLFSLACSHGY